MKKSRVYIKPKKTAHIERRRSVEGMLIEKEEELEKIMFIFSKKYLNSYISEEKSFSFIFYSNVWDPPIGISRSSQSSWIISSSESSLISKF
jgi:CRISPR/Cas system endoribonuclease Cas6 (RAMP superfamily)